MGKFTVYQSNKCITSQKLCSRRPHRVASTQLMENPRIFAPSPRHQEPNTGKPRLFSTFCGYLSDDPAFLSRTRTGHLPSSAGWYRRLTLEVAHPAEKSMSGRLEKSIPLPERVAVVLAVNPLPADRAGPASCFPGRHGEYTNQEA